MERSTSLWWNEVLLHTMMEGLVMTLLSLDFHGQQLQPKTSTTLKPFFSNLPPFGQDSLSCRLSSSDSSSSLAESSEEGDSISSSDAMTPTSGLTATCACHEPPAGVTYDDNDSVFGNILRGELSAKCLAESTNLLAFEDIRPRAPLHALVIPKDNIGSVFDLTPASLALLQDMTAMAEQLVLERFPHAYEKGDFQLCFHVPPFNSVDHLHLHVHAPVSQMAWFYRYVKYNPKTRWCIEVDVVRARLERGGTAVPYRRPPCCKEQPGVLCGSPSQKADS